LEDHADALEGMLKDEGLVVVRVKDPGIREYKFDSSATELMFPGLSRQEISLDPRAFSISDLYYALA